MNIKSKQHKYPLPFISEAITIPDYTILTGLNGSGKTLLLKYINEGVVAIDDINPAEILYYSYDDFLLNSTQNIKTTNKDYPSIAESSGKIELAKYLESLSLGYDNDTEKAIVKFGRPIPYVHEDPTEHQYELFEQARATLPQSYFETEADFGTRLNYLISTLTDGSIDFNTVDIKFAAERYLPITESIKDSLKIESKYLLALYTNDTISYGLPDLFISSLEEAEKAFQIGREKKILSDWYAERLIDPGFNDKYRMIDDSEESPVDLLNRVLKEYDLNGYIIRSNKLHGHYEARKTQKITIEITKGNGYTLAPYQHLSSGEKTLLTLSFFIYKLGLNYPPKVLLLDEIDSFLHPNAVKHLLKVIQNFFVESLKLKVIFATHSLTTVALSPKNAIYAIDLTKANLLTEIDKATAINTLSEGIAAFTLEDSGISLVHQIRKTDLPVIFTEGVTDVITIETAWKKLYPATKQPFDLASLHGEKSIDSHLQTFLREDGEITKSPNRHFIALFDFDAGYTSWNGDRKTFSYNYESDPFKGLTICTANKQVYKMLLPVPEIAEIKEQVIADSGTYEADSKLYIEHYFFDSIPNKFRIAKKPRGGIYVFNGSKKDFADSLETLPVENFKHFKALFDSISKILSEKIL